MKFKIGKACIIGGIVPSKMKPGAKSEMEIKHESKDMIKNEMRSNGKSIFGGSIKLNHLPFGFFEVELLKYFTQFGKVLRVRVARNKKTGNHKGWALILFADRTVAQIAAETMDGYLMYEKRLTCHLLDDDQVPRSLLSGPVIAKRPRKGATIRKHATKQNADRTLERERRNCAKLVSGLLSKNDLLKTMGINYQFVLPSLPAQLAFDISNKAEHTDAIDTKPEPSICTSPVNPTKLSDMTPPTTLRRSRRLMKRSPLDKYSPRVTPKNDRSTNIRTSAKRYLEQ